MFNLKGAVQSFGGQLQKALVIGVLAVMVLLPAWHMTLPDGLPCGSGCQSVMSIR